MEGGFFEIRLEKIVRLRDTLGCLSGHDTCVLSTGATPPDEGARMLGTVKLGAMAAVLAMVAVALTAGVALAATLIGNDAPNTIVGTADSDLIEGSGGGDALHGQGSADAVYSRDGAFARRWPHRRKGTCGPLG